MSDYFCNWKLFPPFKWDKLHLYKIPFGIYNIKATYYNGILSSAILVLNKYIY